MVRDAKTKMWEEFVQEADHKSCWKAAKYGKIRHQMIIKGIRKGENDIESTEEGMVEELMKVTFPEMLIVKDREVIPLDKKPA